RDVILEAPRHRLIELMREPEHAIAAVDIGDHDADAENVHNLREMHVLAQHLFVDAVQVLLAPGHPRLDAVHLELVHEAALDTPERLALIASCAAQRALEHAVAERIEGLEAEILELDLQAVDT